MGLAGVWGCQWKLEVKKAMGEGLGGREGGREGARFGRQAVSNHGKSIQAYYKETIPGPTFRPDRPGRGADGVPR